MKLKGHTDNVKSLLVNKDATQVCSINSSELELGPVICPDFLKFQNDETHSTCDFLQNQILLCKCKT